MEIAERFNQFARPARVARAFTELRATFAGMSRIPDVAVYRWQRIPTDEAGRVAEDFLTPPDIAVEIVSPDQSANALVRRSLWYVANGVVMALLIDPGDESVLLFRPEQLPRALRGRDPIDLGDVLPGFTITVQQLFDALSMR